MEAGGSGQEVGMAGWKGDGRRGVESEQELRDRQEAGTRLPEKDGREGGLEVVGEERMWGGV